jgi:hypothetical protein
MDAGGWQGQGSDDRAIDQAPIQFTLLLCQLDLTLVGVNLSHSGMAGGMGQTAQFLFAAAEMKKGQQGSLVSLLGGNAMNGASVQRPAGLSAAVASGI